MSARSFVRRAALSLAGVLLVTACATAVATPPSEVSPAQADADASTADASPGIDVAPLPAPDASDGAACETPCGLAPQCGCLATQTCDLDGTGARACVSAGTTKAGAACLSTRECAAGLVCGNAVCRAPCAAAGTSCTGDRAGACKEYAQSTSDGGTSSVTYTACAVTCAYDKEDSCGFRKGDLLAAACVYQPSTGTAECEKVRNVQLQSGLCNADAECGAGRVCVAGSGFSSCRRLCKVGDASACGGCGGFTPPRVVGGVTYGFCP